MFKSNLNNFRILVLYRHHSLIVKLIVSRGDLQHLPGETDNTAHAAVQLEQQEADEVAAAEIAKEKASRKRAKKAKKGKTPKKAKKAAEKKNSAHDEL